ncbi:hypothetical protein GCM10009716_34010 [Streptomyces sodiiphilus]|uniref:Bro-N domain-containing protein n=1 Tax=Streptomyces sodiiphilus TaxID=226217 RepID=A0ABN2PII4_9ACTN
MNTTSPALPAGRLKGLGLLADALTYPDTGETVELITARDGTKWFWLHEVAKVTQLPHLRKDLTRRLDPDEWRKIDVSAGQGSVATGDVIRNPMRILVSVPGVLKLLASSRKPSARAFDRWARHEVLAPLLTTGHVPEDGDRLVSGHRRPAASSAIRSPGLNPSCATSLSAAALNARRPTVHEVLRPPHLNEPGRAVESGRPC